ncbi:hypothetical protein PR048_014743 [Dryococelus australis]|uniref:Uncharacterized protein n=1 Tax=Dryococelus australis TaxID=614101 RepID=A0ABQ9HFU8_9NEOP|nr:hypothetical protein PR048_014743 [Dryococelus australis]
MAPRRLPQARLVSRGLAGVSGLIRQAARSGDKWLLMRTGRRPQPPGPSIPIPRGFRLLPPPPFPRGPPTRIELPPESAATARIHFAHWLGGAPTYLASVFPLMAFVCQEAILERNALLLAVLFHLRQHSGSSEETPTAAMPIPVPWWFVVFFRFPGTHCLSAAVVELGCGTKGASADNTLPSSSHSSSSSSTPIVSRVTHEIMRNSKVELPVEGSNEDEGLSRGTNTGYRVVVGKWRRGARSSATSSPLELWQSSDQSETWAALNNEDSRADLSVDLYITWQVLICSYTSSSRALIYRSQESPFFVTLLKLTIGNQTRVRTCVILLTSEYSTRKDSEWGHRMSSAQPCAFNELRIITFTLLSAEIAANEDDLVEVDFIFSSSAEHFGMLLLEMRCSSEPNTLRWTIGNVAADCLCLSDSQADLPCGLSGSSRTGPPLLPTKSNCDVRTSQMAIYLALPSTLNPASLKLRNLFIRLSHLSRHACRSFITYGTCRACQVTCALLTACIIWSSAGMKGRGNWRSPRKPTDQWHRPADSQVRKSGVTRPGIESGSPWWGASRVTARPPWPPLLRQDNAEKNSRWPLETSANFLICGLGSSDLKHGYTQMGLPDHRLPPDHNSILKKLLYYDGSWSGTFSHVNVAPYLSRHPRTTGAWNILSTERTTCIPARAPGLVEACTRTEYSCWYRVISALRRLAGGRDDWPLPALASG